MAFTEEFRYKHEILSSGAIEVRETTVILKDGEEIGASHHRVSYSPGSDLSSADDLTKQIAVIVWTPEVIADNTPPEALAE